MTALTIGYGAIALVKRIWASSYTGGREILQAMMKKTFTGSGNNGIPADSGKATFFPDAGSAPDSSPDTGDKLDMYCFYVNQGGKPSLVTVTVPADGGNGAVRQGLEALFQQGNSGHVSGWTKI